VAAVVRDGGTELTTMREIVLLTGMQEAPHLARFLNQHNPALIVTHVQTRDELALALHPARPGIRLIGFCTSIVVPAAALAACDRGAYNFHPGPPTHPGRHPASFAIYEGIARFAATAHEMRARVDSGPIVGVEWFDLPPAPRLAQVEKLTFEASVALFRRLGPLLATSADPLPIEDIRWNGRKSTQAAFDTMCELPLDIGAAELDRRVRAFADGLKGTLFFRVHGRIFRLDR
jgi:methionyl-tRNA formyltransferase